MVSERHLAIASELGACSESLPIFGIDRREQAQVREFGECARELEDANAPAAVRRRRQIRGEQREVEALHALARTSSRNAASVWAAMRSGASAASCWPALAAGNA